MYVGACHLNVENLVWCVRQGEKPDISHVVCIHEKVAHSSAQHLDVVFGCEQIVHLMGLPGALCDKPDMLKQRARTLWPYLSTCVSSYHH